MHQALTGLPEGEQRRLGVLADWRDGPHLLTYRQAEYTFSLVTAALGKEQPDGLPAPELQRACDDLLEASVPEADSGESSSAPGTTPAAAVTPHSKHHQPGGSMQNAEPAPARKLVELKASEKPHVTGLAKTYQPVASAPRRLFSAGPRSRWARGRSSRSWP